VRDATESRSALSSGKGLPPRGVPLSGVETSPVHETGSVLIGTEEQDLGVLASGQVDNLLLDSGRLTGNEQVDDGVDKVFEAQGEVGIKVGQDGRLGTAFDNEAVFLLLGTGQSVGLVKQGPGVLGVVFPASRSNDPDTTSGDILEPNVESTEIGSDDEARLCSTALSRVIGVSTPMKW